MKTISTTTTNRGCFFLYSVVGLHNLDLGPTEHNYLLSPIRWCCCSYVFVCFLISESAFPGYSKLATNLVVYKEEKHKISLSYRGSQTHGICLAENDSLKPACFDLTRGRRYIVVFYHCRKQTSAKKPKSIMCVFIVWMYFNTCPIVIRSADMNSVHL